MKKISVIGIIILMVACCLISSVGFAELREVKLSKLQEAMNRLEDWCKNNGYEEYSIKGTLSEDRSTVKALGLLDEVFIDENGITKENILDVFPTVYCEKLKRVYGFYSNVKVDIEAIGEFDNNTVYMLTIDIDDGYDVSEHYMGIQTTAKIIACLCAD